MGVPPKKKYPVRVFHPHLRRQLDRRCPDWPRERSQSFARLHQSLIGAQCHTDQSPSQCAQSLRARLQPAQNQRGIAVGKATAGVTEELADIVEAARGVEVKKGVHTGMGMREERQEVAAAAQERAARSGAAAGSQHAGWGVAVAAAQVASQVGEMAQAGWAAIPEARPAAASAAARLAASQAAAAQNLRAEWEAAAAEEKEAPQEGPGEGQGRAAERAVAKVAGQEGTTAAALQEAAARSLPSAAVARGLVARLAALAADG